MLNVTFHEFLTHVGLHHTWCSKSPFSRKQIDSKLCIEYGQQNCRKRKYATPLHQRAPRHPFANGPIVQGSAWSYLVTCLIALGHFIALAIVPSVSLLVTCSRRIFISGIYRNTPTGSGGNEKLPPHRLPLVGIVRKVPLTRAQLSHKHHHHGGAIDPSYGVLTMDTPDRMQATSSEGVGRGWLGGVLYKSIK